MASVIYDHFSTMEVLFFYNMPLFANNISRLFI